ncbi:MAG: inosine/xanthosine triphosphatase [Dyella sp.]
MTAPLMRILVGSRNPVKIDAVRHALTPLFPHHRLECIGIDAPSGVPEQPMTARQTRQGAINRVQYCRQQGQADFYVALEGGVDVFDDGPASFAYAVIADAQRQSLGCSAHLPLPPAAYQALQQGQELGPVMDRLFATHNSKQKGGAMGLLTNGNVTRETVYAQTLSLAMARFLHPDLYPPLNHPPFPGGTGLPHLYMRARRATRR